MKFYDVRQSKTGAVYDTQITVSLPVKRYKNGLLLRIRIIIVANFFKNNYEWEYSLFQHTFKNHFLPLASRKINSIFISCHYYHSKF